MKRKKGGVAVCIYDANIGMFHLVHRKGKAISTYGVSWTRNLSNIDNSSSITSNNNPSIPNKVSSAEYLFIEEALFLHERGLLHVLHESKDDNDNIDETCQKTGSDNNDGGGESDCKGSVKEPMNTQDLYKIMLDTLHIPLQIYLTYSHLRSQTYIVVRHTEHRLNIIKSMDDGGSNGQRKNKNCKDFEEGIFTTTENDEKIPLQDQSDQSSFLRQRNQNKSKKDQLKIQLRRDFFHAPIPFIFGEEDTTNHNKGSSKSQNSRSDSGSSKKIAFDVYEPNSQFRKTCPGRPDFYISITNFAQPSPTFMEIKQLIDACDGIPLRMAAVADGGTVIMFSLTDFGVPTLEGKINDNPSEIKQNKNQ